jgi:hypothetical protein
MSGKTIGEIFREYEQTSNPVTKAVRRQIIANRLDRIEAKTVEKKGSNHGR